MLLTFCLMFGILAAGTDGTPAGAPLEPTVRMLRPAILRESNATRIAVLLTLINQRASRSRIAARAVG